MKLPPLRIVLVATSHPGNIGSTARAMKTMGLTDLYLVKPRHFPHLNAFEMSAGAQDIIQNAIVVETLAEALSGCYAAMATTARSRSLPLPFLTPEQAGAAVHTGASRGTVALVFGREQTGLTNEELLQCHYQVSIPANPEYSSLNIAQAVQIMAYEVRKQGAEQSLTRDRPTEESATVDDIEGFYTHFERVLIAIDFLNVAAPRRLMQRFRRLFNRAQLEKTEVNILRGVLTQVEQTIRK